ncbi:MAG: response regulator [Verrucomicrobiota bacterium]
MKTKEQPDQIVYLVDDDEPLRVAMTRLLRAEGFETRDFASAADFLLSRDEILRGCLILDVRMPGGPSGLELHQSLLRQNERLPVIFLTGHGDVPMSVKAIKSGAFDFLIKPTPKDILVATVKAAMEKESDSWTSGQKRHHLVSRFSSLTPREQAVYHCVIAGMPNKQIGSQVGSAERTVKAHRASVMRKMGASSVAGLVHMADELREPAEK